MDLHRLLFILVCVKLSGGQDIISVRHTSVQRGQSIVIPCLYKPKYQLSSKYLSYGYLAQRYHHETVFISDDQSRHIFTVRLDDLQDSGHYWCGVQTPAALDERAGFFVEVTAGPPRLSVSHQNVSGPEHGSVSVTCRHRGQSGVRWCKLGGQCITATSATLDGAAVEVRYDVELMTVIMRGLKVENAGWYYCSTADLQMPVHITVQQDTRITLLPRKRTMVLLVLSVLLEMLLLIVIYSALKLLEFCRDRLFRRETPAEDSQYMTMHRKRSSRSLHGCAAAEGEYESMAEIQTNVQPGREDDYVNIREM